MDSHSLYNSVGNDSIDVSDADDGIDLTDIVDDTDFNDIVDSVGGKSDNYSSVDVVWSALISVLFCFGHNVPPRSSGPRKAKFFRKIIFMYWSISVPSQVHMNGSSGGNVTEAQKDLSPRNVPELRVKEKNE